MQTKAVVGVLGALVLFAGWMAWSYRSEQSPEVWLLANASRLATAVRAYESKNGIPPATLEEVCAELNCGYPDQVVLPTTSRSLAERKLPLHWLYLRPSKADDSSIVIASPLPFLRGGSLKRIVVRADGRTEIIDEQLFGQEMEASLHPPVAAAPDPIAERKGT